MIVGFNINRLDGNLQKAHSKPLLAAPCRAKGVARKVCQEAQSEDAFRCARVRADGVLEARHELHDGRLIG